MIQYSLILIKLKWKLKPNEGFSIQLLDKVNFIKLIIIELISFYKLNSTKWEKALLIFVECLPLNKAYYLNSLGFLKCPIPNQNVMTN